MRGLLLCCVLACGCGWFPMPLTNDQEIAAIKKCEAAGLKAKRIVDINGRTAGIVCTPVDER